MNLATVDRSYIEQLVRAAVQRSLSSVASPVGSSDPPGWVDGKPNLRVSISARHCHLTDDHVEILFGPGAKLEPDKDLYQDGFYAAKQTVMVVGPRRRMFSSVRVLGPTRPSSQVELALTDSISLGIDAPIRHSGKIDGTPGCVLGWTGWDGAAGARRDSRRTARPHESVRRGLFWRHERRLRWN